MSDSSPAKNCPDCGAHLPPDAPEGQCPRCLMAQIIDPTQAGDRAGPLPVLTAEDLAPHFPPYEIQRILGRGGMGAVYLARQISLNRLVAIKILPADLGDCDMGFAERFKNEAQAMAQLSHPGIVAVFDFGETANGLLYIVMEYIEGTDVQQMVSQQGRLHSAHAMAVTAHVCDALAYAHSRGIIHRDIKPSNIMVSNDGVVKVADFGLAKMSKSGETGLTQSGMAMGTLHFMAPEFLTLGTPVDQRADIYAVGVMLYQMLTGKLPQGLFEMPSLQVPGLDPRYDGIVAKALREDRAVRYQQASELRHDLDAILTQPVVKVEPESDQAPAAVPPSSAKPQRPAGQPYRPPQRSAPPSPKKRSSTGLILVSLGVLAVIAAAVFFVGERTTTTTQPALASKTMPFVNTLGMKFVPVPITGGPTDGKHLLFGIWDTRVQDYEVFANETKHDWPKPDFEQAPTHPAVQVSWHDAQAFCTWMTERERAAGKLGPNERYRLPSDHEWSCAVELGAREDAAKQPKDKNSEIDGLFPWGTQWPPPKGAGNYAGEELQAALAAGKTGAFSPGNGVIVGYQDGFVNTSPVGSFAANPLGLYDMGGNVGQWCEDWAEKDQKHRVVRGSSWSSLWLNNIRAVLRSSLRNYLEPRFRSNDLGFRIVLETSAPVVATAPTDKPLDPQPARATKVQPFVNTLGMKFVPVPGTDVMFCIHETRYQDYAAYAAASPGVDVTYRHQGADRYYPSGRTAEHPVMQVSWEDVQKFLAWLSQKEGKTYRLPTDQEWSIAAGIGRDERWEPGTTPASVAKNLTSFPWGDQWPPPPGSGNYSDASRKAQAPRDDARHLDGYDDRFPTTAPVMSYPPNSFGLHDMGGNVWEYCADWYNHLKIHRVWRGGSWDSYERAHLLSSHRWHNLPTLRNSHIGFRCVLEISSQAASEPAPNLPNP